MCAKLFFTGILFTAALAIADGKGAASKKTAQLVEGKKVFEMNCVVCHGAEGKGDGAAAAALNPKPRNFTDAAYMKGRPLTTLKQVVTDGGQSVGLSPIMAGWNGTLTPKQIDAVLQYVLSMSETKTAKKKA